eukprot:gnl/TRDRNA2_/TRDRNA2_38595_c0_seq1.p1 gnl/TRDRNA2_/TRDRNA2_38595_c0~~gnl/TRDRNA2_/TRDRNA2_38595_c0_seq1.p1  ORF type:complete len:385 (+),score=68.91 gnl/TRDRNA2_/TRDRNA2_38595_c0_seq1:93-1247(+)
MPWNDYSKVREIGKGSFGHAYLIQTAAKKLLVMKEIDISKMRPDEKSRAEVEVKVLSAMKHPYIVKYCESFVHDRHLCIVMDYCEGGDLSAHIQQCKKYRQPIPQNQILRWFTQMSLALKYMHERNVLHRDIKTQNIFLSRMADRPEEGVKGCVKIADFGISKVLASQHAMARTVTGTPYYMSPEICQKQPYACPSDVWAVGCVLFELCALHVPFDAGDLNELRNRIVRGNAPRIPDTYSKELSTLASEMLCRQASGRPTAATILQRPIVQAEIKRMLGDNQKENQQKPKAIGEMVGRDAAHRQPDSARGPSKECGARERAPSAPRGREGAPPRPLGENNARYPARDASPAKGLPRANSRGPSPQRAAAQEVIKPSRCASPRRV